MAATGTSARRSMGPAILARRTTITVAARNATTVSASRKGRMRSSTSAGCVDVSASAFRGQSTPHVDQGVGSGKCPTTSAVGT
jgi:hypothetical protein